MNLILNRGVSKVIRGARNRSGNRVFCMRVRRKRIIRKLFATISCPNPLTKDYIFRVADNFLDELIMKSVIFVVFVHLQTKKLGANWRN